MSESSGETQKITINLLATDKDARSIIGKSGSTIKDICSKTNCNVVLRGPIRTERFISLTGLPAQISSAVESVTECLINNPQMRRDLDDESFENSTCILMLLPHRITGAIIGQKGGNIKNIKEVSKAKLRVIFDNRSENNENILCIEGNPSQIAKAVEVVAKVWHDLYINSTDKEGMESKYIDETAYSNGAFLSTLSTKCGRTFYIDQHVASIIIGKRGYSIKNLRKMTGANVVVGDSSSGYCILEISGSPSCVALAIRLIEIEISLESPSSNREYRQPAVNGNSRRSVYQGQRENSRNKFGRYSP